MIRLHLLSLLTSLLLTTSAHAEWVAREVLPAGSVTAGQAMPVLVCTEFGCTAKAAEAEQLQPSIPAVAMQVMGLPAGLPDGLVSVIQHGLEDEAAQVGAYYTAPTDRYGHGILGDAIEGGALTLTLSAPDDPNNQPLTHVLAEAEVFEDLYPRLIDFDGFGKLYAVTLLAHIEKGAAIAVFEIAEGRITEVARTPHIGTPNRWRNIAGIADFDGDGSLQIAEVVTPHIGGTLKFWTWRRGVLEPSGKAYGFSNHAIGSRVLKLSAVDDFNGDGVDDLALPDASRRAVVIMAFEGRAEGEKTLVELARLPLPAEIDKRMMVGSSPTGPVLTLGLKDGSVWSVLKPPQQP